MAYIVDIDNPNNIKAAFLKGEDVPVGPINYELTELEEQLLNDAITSLNEVNSNHRYMTFGFITDLHESYNDIPYGSRVVTSKPSLKLLGAIGQAYGLDGVFFGGDYSTGNELTYEQYDAALEELLTTVAGTISVPHFATEGNHDRRYKSSLPCRGNAVWRDFLERFNTPGRAVFPDENNTANGYEANTYYVDFPKYKVRVVMRSQYETVEEWNTVSSIGTGHYPNNIESCMKFDDPSKAERWTILCVSHNATTGQLHWNGESCLKKFLNGSLNDGHEGRGIVGELFGHVHDQYSYVVNNDGDLVRISQWNAFTYKDYKIGTGTGFDGPEEYQYQFSLYVIDTDRCMLHVIQVGRPYNRTGNSYYDSTTRIFSYPYRNNKPEAGNTLKFYHISDVHRTTASLEKCDALMSDPENDAAFTIFTGDFATDGYSINQNQDIKSDFVNFSNKHEFLMVHGNHDSWEAFGSNHNGFSSACARFFLEGGKKGNTTYPGVLGNNVVWGTSKSDAHDLCSDSRSKDLVNNSITHGGDPMSSYWYKDYQVPAGGKLRVIGIDSWQYRNEGEQNFGQYDTVYLDKQVEWFIDRINELDGNDYLLIALHNPPVTSSQAFPDVTAVAKRRVNKFCSSNIRSWQSNKGNGGLWAMIVNAYKSKTASEKVLNNVEVYSVNRSGELASHVTVNADFRGKTPCTFLGYLCGHTHTDIVCKHPAYPDQIIMCVDCSTSRQNELLYDSDIPYNNRLDSNGNPLHVLINEVTVDFYAKEITIKRIGNGSGMEGYHKTGSGNGFPAIARDEITFGFDGSGLEE